MPAAAPNCINVTAPAVQNISRSDRALDGRASTVASPIAPRNVRRPTLAAYLCSVFSDDPEFQESARIWGQEEVLHGKALARWAALADPDFDFEASFKRFTDGFRLPLGAESSVRGSRTGEFVARCIVEIGTSSFYAALRDSTDEPVLKAICEKTAADEVRHYNLFRTHSDIVERRVTQVLEDQIAGISGITKMSSRSFDERSSITLEFNRDRDIDSVANDVRDRVSRVLRMLPDEADPPSVSKQDGFAGTTMWINVSSDTRSMMEVSDFAERYLVDALSIVDGVAMIRGSGSRRPAMRIWVDPKRLAARGLTVTDIEDALRRENVQIPSGRLESNTREFTLRTDTGSGRLRISKSLC